MDKIKVSLQRCPNCSASLSIQPQDVDIRCTYCGHSIHIERRSRASRSGDERNILYIRKRPSRPVTLAAVLLALGMVALPLAFSAGPKLWRGLHTHIQPFPAVCGDHEELTLSGQSFSSAGSGPLIRAGSSCRLKIRDCTLTADVVVQGAASVEIEIENSTLTGHERALDLGDDSKITIRAGSKIEAPIAIAAGSGLDLTVAGSSVSGEELAVRAGMAAQVVLTEAQLHGGTAALQTLHGLKLDARQGRIESEKDAVVASFGSHIEARRSAIRGGRYAFTLSGQPSPFSLVETTVEGMQDFARR